jgi:F-type H+-transporting ATPase subunit b
MFQSINITRLVTVALNLFILYLFMRRFLFKPVTAYMENRSNAIRQSIESADQLKAEAEALKRQYEERLQTANTEANRITGEAGERASLEYEQILAAARTDAESILAKAREAIDRERSGMINEIKNQVVSLALAAASKVIQANMNTESDRVMVNKFIDEADVP